MTPSSREPKYNTVVGQAVLKAIYETTVLVFTKTKEPREVFPHSNKTKKHAFITSRGIIDVYPGRHFYIATANFGMADVHLSKHQNFVEVRNAPKKQFTLKTSISRTSLAQNGLKMTAASML